MSVLEMKINYYESIINSEEWYANEVQWKINLTSSMIKYIKAIFDMGKYDKQRKF